MFQSRYRYIFIGLLAVYSYLNILFTGGDKLFNLNMPLWQLLIILLLITLLVWESNHLLWRWVKDWENSLSRLTPLLPFFLISLAAVFLIATAITYAVLAWMGAPLTNHLDQLKLTLAFAFRINLFLHTVNAIIYFNTRLKNTQVEAERLKAITLESQFEALRNQINPHFLFNSLNVLSGLVHKDADLSTDFIQQLAKVYRYLLYNQDSKMVSLRAEMEFIEAFVFLLKIRFGEQLLISQQIPEEALDSFQIPPASVQILVENAIKHNVTSESRPLKVSIHTEDQHLVVSNNLQRKKTPPLPGGYGLHNLERRYQYLVQEPVEVTESEHYFSVKLPLLRSETILSSVE